MTTIEIAELRALLAAEKDARHHLSLPGDPAYMMDEDRKKRTYEALRNAAASALPSLLDRLEAGRVGWQDIASAPRDGTHFLATTIVRNAKTGQQWWQTYVIWADDETGEVHNDCDHGWSQIDDYSHWMPLPAPPQQKADTP